LHRLLLPKLCRPARLDTSRCMLATSVLCCIVSCFPYPKCVGRHAKMHAGNKDSKLDIGIDFDVAAAMTLYHVAPTGNFVALEGHEQGEMGVGKETIQKGNWPVI